MFSTSDTIVAIATPSGRGGIGVVRISGPDALRIASALTGEHAFQPRHATLVRVQGLQAGDRAIATWFQAPASFTGDEVVEISAHGSPVLLRAIVQAALAQGARLAEAGEFTLRAYLNGRIDLVQAEAIRDLIEAVTPLQARAAFDQLEGTLTARIREIDAALFDLSARLEASLDFAGEGYHFIEPGQAATEIQRLIARVDTLLGDARGGRLVREGAQVVIAGRPNAGKSTLFNALAGADRAIVTEIPGTTRDLLSELVDIEGIAVTLVDTAGIRLETTDAVEAEGVSRARLASRRADLVVLVIDGSQQLAADDRELLATSAGVPRVIVAAKRDLPDAGWVATLDDAVVAVSAPRGEGLRELREAIAAALGAGTIARDTPAITNMRHVQLLDTARTSLERAFAAAEQLAPEELIAADLADARSALEEITGRRTVDDTLQAIFERFCIGK